jgi:hypothetical protein
MAGRTPIALIPQGSSPRFQPLVCPESRSCWPRSSGSTAHHRPVAGDSFIQRAIHETGHREHAKLRWPQRFSEHGQDHDLRALAAQELANSHRAPVSRGHGYGREQAQAKSPLPTIQSRRHAGHHSRPRQDTARRHPGPTSALCLPGLV